MATPTAPSPQQQQTPSSFMSVENMKVCMTVFKKYMFERHAYDVESDVVGGAAGLRKVLYAKMQGVASMYPDPKAAGLSLRDMNNLTLNECRDHYKNSSSSSSEAPPPQVPLSTRPTQSTIAPLTAGPVVNEDVEQSLKSLEAMRRQHDPVRTPPSSASAASLLEPFKENALASSDFEAKMAALKSDRETATVPVQQETNQRFEETVSIISNSAAAGSDHPGKDLALASGSVFKAPPTPTPVSAPSPDLSPSSTMQDRSKFITTLTNVPTKLTDQYLIVNGSDRDWNLYRDRFRVVADFGGLHGDSDLQGRYRNIRSISMKRCIIPQEICDVSSFGNVAKSFYTHNYSFNVPYVLISIDEIADVFDGTNDAVRRSFCQMIVDKHYRSANGRGYFVLVAMQDERKVFHPVPLSRLSKMTITVRKPNGEIFNESRDDFSVAGVSMDPVNPTYVQIMFDKYFDKNEFYKGDTIRIKRYQLSRPTQDIAVAQGSTGSLRKMEDFINRASGHDIMELGQPNQQGYFKTLFIRAPGKFDPAQGRFVTESECMDVLNADDVVAIADTAHAINMSLQCSFSFKLELVSPDVSADLQKDTLTSV
jgi:hypothetical protein